MPYVQRRVNTRFRVTEIRKGSAETMTTAKNPVAIVPGSDLSEAQSLSLPVLTSPPPNRF